MSGNYKILLSFILLFLFQCKPKEKIPPVFPSENDLIIDLSYFTEPSDNNGNYARAYEVVETWIPVLNDSLQLYNDLINAVYGEDFDYQDKNTWLVEKVLNKGNKEYGIKYFETVNADTVETKLFFSLDTVYSDLLLFDGAFIPDSTTGYREINLPDTSNTYIKFLRLDWNNVSSSKKEIKYTNALIGGKKGNYIFYKDSNDVNYNIYFDIYDKAAENHTYIEYNNTNLSGRIKDEQFFGDTNWHAWDENRTDIIKQL